jgi:hypothetical protein
MAGKAYLVFVKAGLECQMARKDKASPGLV